MIKPSLTNFTDFIEKPKPVIPKSPKQIQRDINFYMNIIISLIICIGLFLLYTRNKYKEIYKLETIEKLKQFDTYMQDYIINDMLTTQNNNNT
tara:strand:+ start:1657 stop:1935 length:279 start_codon:yes stop_codon:yes gene_type:complete